MESESLLKMMDILLSSENESKPNLLLKNFISRGFYNTLMCLGDEFILKLKESDLLFKYFEYLVQSKQEKYTEESFVSSYLQEIRVELLRENIFQHNHDEITLYEEEEQKGEDDDGKVEKENK